MQFLSVSRSLFSHFRVLPFLVLAVCLGVLTAAERTPFPTVRFEQNRGQAAGNVRYIARAHGHQIFFTDAAVILAPPGAEPVRLSFPGAKPLRCTPTADPVDSISYFLGNDPSKWVRSAPIYERLSCPGVYPGIGVVFYGSGDRLEYDLVLAAHADPSRIRLRFSAPARVGIDGAIQAGPIRQRTPSIYQHSPDGARSLIQGRFAGAAAGDFRIELGAYQPSLPLIVDPVLELATYIGGENDDEIVAVTDGFVAGNTRSLIFALNSPQLRPSRDVFVRGTGPVIPGRIDRTASSGTLVFGGAGDDEVAGMALGSLASADLLIAGTTNSPDIAISASTRYHGGASDAFVAYVQIAQFFPRLTGFMYIGGSGEDRATAFAAAGFIHALAGITDSPDLAAQASPQPNLAGGRDAFYALIYQNSSVSLGYLGGSADDAAYAIDGNTRSIWIGGETRSPDFPFAQTGLSGPSDAFLTEVAVSFPQPQPLGHTSHRIGGSGEDSISALVLNPASIVATDGGGNLLRPTFNTVALAGVTSSPDLTLVNASQTRFGGETDAFSALWDVRAAAPLWLTYIGGSGADGAAAISQDWSGGLYVGGFTRSADLPVINALQSASGGGEDGLFAVFEPGGKLAQLTYYGGSGDDRIRGVRFGYNSTVRVVGSTTSTDLPEQQPWYPRSSRSEGFVAEIGSDHLIGLSTVAMPKDGSFNFSLRPGRRSPRAPLTLRSSDPSRLRFAYSNRTFDELTISTDEILTLEALSDNGEVTVTITSPGFSPKHILVKLYPGAFVGATYSAPFSTWSAATVLAAGYYAIGPDDRPIGNPVGFRNGVTFPGYRWTVSDSRIFELSIAPNTIATSQVRALRPGEVTLTLSVEGFRVLQPSTTIRAQAPQLGQPAPIRLGRNLQVQLPLAFNADIARYRGTVTARVSDSSRLLVSNAFDVVGSEQATANMDGRQPLLYAQALASEGEVQVFISSSEFEGEIPFTVILERTFLHWGTSRFIGGRAVIDPSVKLFVGGQRPALDFALLSESGAPNSLRAGAPPMTLVLANSNPEIVEVDRLTLTSFERRHQLTGLRPGASELTSSLAADWLALANSSVAVTVEPSVSPLFQSAVTLGKDLQVRFEAQLVNPGNDVVEVLSDDPTAVLISSSRSLRGQRQLVLSPPFSNRIEFYLQGFKSQGETVVRLRIPGLPERIITVSHRPSGPGISTFSSTSNQDFTRRASISLFAYDPETRVGLGFQAPSPGSPVEVRLRSEGAAIRLSRDRVVFTSESEGSQFVDLTEPEPGGQATLIAEVDGATDPGPLNSRATIWTPPASSRPNVVSTMALLREQIALYSFFSLPRRPVTATSSDPERVLISAQANEPGSATLNVASLSAVYIHALGGSGTASVRFELPGAASFEVEVLLAPAQLNSSILSVAPGRTTTATVSLNAGNNFRPGAPPVRFTLRSENPSIATVQPESVELHGPGGRASAPYQVAGVARGTTRIFFEGPSNVLSLPLNLVVIEPSSAALTRFNLGNNLQAELQLELGSDAVTPSGSIVTVASSDPNRLVLSRAASVPGASSISVAVLPQDPRTQPFFAQALSPGEVTLNVTRDGRTTAVFALNIVPSWYGCSRQGTLVVGIGQLSGLTCFVTYMRPLGSAFPFRSVTLRAGLDPSARLTISNSSVAAVDPESVPLSSTVPVTVRGLSLGEAELRIEQPPGFGPVPDNSALIPVRVVLPALSTSCSDGISIARDTQRACNINLPAGVTFTAASSHPSLIVLSPDPQSVGSGAITATSSGSAISITFQALASAGTAEVLLSAPGYQDLLIPVVLRPSILGLESSFSGTLRVGATATLRVVMNPNTSGASKPRAGADISFSLTSSPGGIVSLDPERVTFKPGEDFANITIRALAPGSTLIRMSAEGFAISGFPLALAVNP